MKECPNCHAMLNDNVRFCSSCGSALPEAPASNTAEQPYQPIFSEDAEQAAPRAKTKMEFLKTDGSHLVGSCNAAAIICYVCAAITLIFALVTQNLFSFIDIGVLLGLGLGIHLRKSTACAIILLIYAIINIIITLVLTGQFGGWLVLVAGIMSTINTTKIDRAWQDYSQHNQALQNNTQQSGQQQPAAAPQQNREPAADEWKCTNCGTINKNYVGTCVCGTKRPR